MDGTRFDAWTQGLATSAPRRAVVRALAGGAFGVLLARFTPEEVGAECRAPGKKCDKNKDCCDGATCKNKTCVCKNGGNACGAACCGAGEVCFGAVDQPEPVCCPTSNICGARCCPPGRVCVCLKPQPFDPAPDPDLLCVCRCPDGHEEGPNGTCTCPAPCGDDCCEPEDGEVCCETPTGKQCVLTKSSAKHCGACNHPCPKDWRCKAGKCVNRWTVNGRKR